MKRFFKYVVIAIGIIILSFTIYKLTNKYNLNIVSNNMECSVITKGCEKAEAVEVKDNNIYIAYDKQIKCIDEEGKEITILKNKDLNIEDMACYNKKILYISEDTLQSYSLDDKSIEVLQRGIPKGGNGISRKLLIYKDKLYITIPAATNSGISENGEMDLSPIDITLSGDNYGGTGAFKKKGTEAYKGEKIKKVTFGNGAVYEIDLKNNKTSLYASGIRGITGVDFDSENKMTAIFSGITSEGLRGVDRDKDYIYKIEKGNWYGWPDYSGGDPITSPRFKNGNELKPIIENPPRKVIEGPLYQHDKVNSLRELAIDKKGEVLGKDIIVFWDKDRNVISALNKDKVHFDILKLKTNSNVRDIVMSGGNIFILDNSIGCIYKMVPKSNGIYFNIPIVVWIFIIILVMALIFVALLKLTKDNN